MKKLFLFAAAAALMTACSETEVLEQSNKQEAIENQGGVKFDVYAQRGVTRGGGYTGDITNSTIVGKDKGFGVFAYYTPGETYSTSATPNFMYNQKIWTETDPATVGTLWKYEPVKYWPNEYGNAAISDEVDKVSFFAYAPWTEVEPTTGEIVPKAKPDTWDESKLGSWKEHEQKFNIISVNKNTQTGDPIVKYVVDTNPLTSVDLLWGVAAETAKENYTPIDGNDGTKKANKDVEIRAGFPFIDLVKPNNPVDDRLVFNLKHALAKVRVTIDYIADQKTPAEGTTTTNELSEQTDYINSDETRIWVRQFNIEGWATEGSLNLNNTEAGEGLPLWKDFDGVKDINFTEVIYQDGLKDGAEGQGKIDKGETLLGLNPAILEDATVNAADADGKITKFSRTNPGVGAMTADVVKEPEVKAGGDKMVQKLGTNAAIGTTLLFGGDPNVNGGYFYVIPRNANEGVNVKIIYDVETIDPSLAEVMSDKVTKGSSIENVISKESIFGDKVDFEPGKQYDIHIHLGMTSVKIEATVTPWVENGITVVDLPENQNPDQATDFTADPQGGTEYYFVSYFDKDDDVAIEANSVKVLANTNDKKFVGSYVGVEVQGGAYPGSIFYVAKNAALDGTTKTQLLKLEDNVLKATGIWVQISESAITLPTAPTYAFTCEQYSTSGTAKIEAEGLNYKITVLTNTVDSFVNQVFYAKRPAKVGDSIQLYTDAACETLANLVITVGAKQ